ncbi:hypothetical protein FRZ67_02635 [Panacibacter ginsenosidivorans]|uniref:Uncharacterized protein n=1 Tax=Panacibacter ginsenosidivorans TaxID=1813871 RepID=A0A5B8V5C3_9BACT|nr:hypothetical protein [Panacibacter ginsenosidivorans]QEC66255.1 hypothetical protein FRZ67_02635 [Panacibacter ginsenosidivorans]
MPNTIAEYYTDELVDWNNAIVFYNNEMDEFDHKLAEVISRNSIVGIAEKVEAHQSLLNKVSEKFYKLEMEIQQQETALKTDSMLIDNASINDTIEKRQMELRSKIQAAEKEYIDIKFGCYNFLSDTLRKKKD